MVTAALLALLAAAPRPNPASPSLSPSALPALPSPADAKRVGDWPKQESGKRVTIGEHVSIDDALEKIAVAAGWNLVANTGRLGDRELVVTFHDTPVEEALDAVLEGSPLVATRHGKTVTVAPGRTAPPQETPTLSGFEKPTGKRFSGDFSDTPIGEALRKVSDAAGLSIVLPPGLRGSVSAHFREAPVEEALKVLLGQSGLVAAREGSILTVAREGGPSLVIGGGRRRLAFPGEADLDRDVGESVRDAVRAARDAAREAQREARQGGEKARGEGAAKRHPGDRVLRGDQVIGAGERANDVVVLLGSVRLDPGAAAHQITAVMGSVDLAPGVQVDGEVVAIGGDIHVSPGARVGGDAVSVGGKIIIDEGAEIEGQQTSVDIPGVGSLLTAAATRGRSIRPHAPLWRAGSVLLEFVVFFGLALLAFVLAPARVERLAGGLVNAPVKTALTGILATMALPFALLLLVVTVVGIPFAFVAAFIVLPIATVVGYTALALYFGRALPFRFERGAPILHLALGTAILVGVGQIPIVGGLAWVAGWLFVFGVVLRTRFGQPPHAPPPVYGTTAPPPIPPPA